MVEKYIFSKQYICEAKLRLLVFKDQSNYDGTAITEYKICKSSDRGVTNITIGNPSGFNFCVFFVGIFVVI